MYICPKCSHNHHSFSQGTGCNSCGYVEPHQCEPEFCCPVHIGRKAPALVYPEGPPQGSSTLFFDGMTGKLYVWTGDYSGWAVISDSSDGIIPAAGNGIIVNGNIVSAKLGAGLGFDNNGAITTAVAGTLIITTIDSTSGITYNLGTLGIDCATLKNHCHFLQAADIIGGTNMAVQVNANGTITLNNTMVQNPNNGLTSVAVTAPYLTGNGTPTSPITLGLASLISAIFSSVDCTTLSAALTRCGYTNPVTPVGVTPVTPVGVGGIGAAV